MPKEVVYADPYPAGTSDSEQLVPIAEVRWHREGGYVQLVTKATDSDNGRVDGSGESASSAHVTDGFYVNLPRASINQLIRNLRRARDQAFGRDE